MVHDTKLYTFSFPLIFLIQHNKKIFDFPRAGLIGADVLSISENSTLLLLKALSKLLQKYTLYIMHIHTRRDRREGGCSKFDLCILILHLAERWRTANLYGASPRHATVVLLIKFSRYHPSTATPEGRLRGSLHFSHRFLHASREYSAESAVVRQNYAFCPTVI